MSELKVLVADNSLVYKKMFTQGIKEVSKNASVVCVANGDEAFSQIKHINFDIIVIDAEIAGMSLFDLLRVIKIDIPKTFILVMVRPSSARDKFISEAISRGANECMIKPIDDSYSENLDIIKHKITDIIGIISGNGGNGGNCGNSGDCGNIRNCGNSVNCGNSGNNKGKCNIPIGTGDGTELLDEKSFSPDIVLIAASTGGPAALETIIPKIRRDFPVPILIIQHIPTNFTENMARNLDQKSKIKVKVAENNESISAGTAYIAPGGAHMILDKNNRICFDDSPPRSGVRPAADVLFESVAANFTGSGVLVVILTGMGSDGKEGLIRLKAKKECFCLAQSEETCVVYGMPRAVTEVGLTDMILDPDMISSRIEDFKHKLLKS